MKFFLVLILSCSFLTGCATKRYSEFSGRQVWPVTAGSVADTSYAVPVYGNWPESPYRVIGSIQLAKNKWKNSDIAPAVRLAKANGADALVIQNGGEFSPAWFTSNVALSRLFMSAQAGALVIQWKPQNEVDESNHRLDGFRSYLRESYPALHLEAKDDLWKMGLAYVTWLGLEIDSQPGTAKLEDILSRLIVDARNSNTSYWLFKGTFRLDDSTSPPIKETIYGVATNIQTGQKIIITSMSGKTEIKVNGVVQDGRLRGQISLSNEQTIFTGQLKGTMAADKIVATGQGQAANGPVQVELIFRR